MELSPNEIRAKAERAEALFSSDSFKEFVRDTEARLVDDWKEARTVEKREDAHAKLRALADMVTQIATAIGNREILDWEAKKQKRTPLLAETTER